MFDVFTAVLPVFMILGLGMILDRLHALPESFSGQLSEYVFKIAMPCLLFRMVAGSELDLGAMGGFLAAMFLGQMAVYVLGYYWVRRKYTEGKIRASIIALACACSNSGFLGLPIIDSLMPGSHEAMVAAGLACIMPPLVLVCAQSVIECSGESGSAERTNVLTVIFKAIVLNPFVIATVLGMGLSLAGFTLWKPIDKVLALVGSTGAPCALVALGLDMWRKMVIARRVATPHRLAWQSGIAVIKLLIHPVLVWLLLAAAGVGGVWLAVGVILSGTSTAVMAYVLSEITHAMPEECALAVVVTAFLSMFTIPVFALALQTGGFF